MIFLELGIFFFFSIDDLTLNDVTLILGTDIDADVSIETHMKYDKLLILMKKVTNGLIYNLCKI
jgi:hypothetical protein